MSFSKSDFLFFLSWPLTETWYVMENGRDQKGCGNSTENPCKTLLYLLQQVNWTHLPPDKELHISTDKSLTIDQQTAVSTNFISLGSLVDAQVLVDIAIFVPRYAGKNLNVA